MYDEIHAVRAAQPGVGFSEGMMDPFGVVHAHRPATGRGGLSLAVGLVVVLLGVVLGASGCSTGVSEAIGTPAPVSASNAQGPEAVWPFVSVGQNPLFDLNVTEARGFTPTERDYLRAERTAWRQVCRQADRYSSLTRAGDAEGAQEALAGIIRRGTIAGSAPSPSPRFLVLRDNVRSLMERVVNIAVTLEEYGSAENGDEQTAAAGKVVRLSAPLAEKVLHTTDWGLALYCSYGRLAYPEYSVAATATAPATTTTTVTTTVTTVTGGGSSPGGGGGDQPQPNPKPQPTLTSPEKKQVAAVIDLDAWLVPVVNDSLAQVSAQPLPWTDSEVESFCLNMSYLSDQCSVWMQKSPAGSQVAGGLREYQKGLSLVTSGASKMQSAAQYNDSAHQKALEKGAGQMETAIPHLNAGLAKLERWY
jgi:hypothetical protein